VAGFIFLRFLPLRSRLKSVRAQQVSQTVALTRASSVVSRIESSKRQLKQLKEKVGDFELRIPPRRELGTFIGEIANLMNRHNLREHQVEPGDEIDAEDLKCIPLAVSCRGNLKQIFEFFRSLQKIERLVRIERVELVNDRDFKGDVSMRARAIICYEPPEHGQD